MIPSVVAAEVAGALGDFLATGFGPSNPALAHVVDDFLAEPENLAKGPYLSVALPFEPAAEGGEPFPEVPLGFTPYRHQRTAFSRLAAGAGRSTVVATGTGSGKTECFLFPILDHCRQRAGAPGVKAILVYPMNALAADQARRIAQTIDRTPALRGRVTAGLFVGRDNQPQRSAHKTMGRDHVVTDRDTLRERPPDILLTNYKMLDYLLVRPFDFRLWRRNRPETLRYLVVDELHTFDGAQGTDLACLIRRLRVRLGVPRDKLICAGTSATLGDGDDEAGLLDYASRIFDQPFEPGAVVGEVRQSIDAFLGGTIISRHLHAADDLAARVDPTRYPTAEAYLRTQHELFFGTSIEGEFASDGFVSEFIAPDRLWRRDFVTLQRESRLPAGSRLPEAVAERLRWDTLAELGYRSAIGRTLERTRAAAVGADRDALERACGGAHIRIREKFGGLRDLAAGAVRALLLGVLRRMKDRGAIRSAVAAAWLAAGGGRWWISRQPALQDFGPRSARPVFPVDTPHAADGIEPLFSRNGGRKSWYQAWVERVLTPVDVLAATREAPDVLLEALGALEAAGLVCRIEAGRAGRAWALDPARFYATARTAVMRCAGSNRCLVVPEPEADLWIGAPCLDLGVQAVYGRRAAEPPTWFGRLYRETLVRRLVAAEHTALLTRDERDHLQRRFSNPDPRPWEPNLLSATPTLELGIDVGDLSTVVLCSVPPAQANYLQRIGRAGRRDGNAFTATVAAGQPHDLYFYAEPLAMLAGRIEPPGVFLNAPAVLERQLTAFCLDAWAATGLPDDAVPRTVRHVLDNVEQARLTGFLYPFLDFVQRRGDDLLQFLPGTWWTTRVGVERGVYPEFPPAAEGQAPPGPAPGLPAGDWRDAVELAVPEVHDLLRELAARGAPPPEVGFELAGAGGAVLADAELGWPAHRVAVLPADRRAEVAAFESAGWRAFTTGGDGLVHTLTDLFAGGTVPPDGEGAR